MDEYIDGFGNSCLRIFMGSSLRNDEDFRKLYVSASLKVPSDISLRYSGMPPVMPNVSAHLFSSA